MTTIVWLMNEDDLPPQYYRGLQLPPFLLIVCVTESVWQDYSSLSGPLKSILQADRTWIMKGGI